MHRGQPVYGMMAQPFTRERFYGDGKRASSRTLAALARRRAAHGMGDPEPAHPLLRLPCRGDADDDQPVADSATTPTGRPIARVERQVRLTRYGGDCYAYCALAAGFVDLVIETNLKPHDIVALMPIIEGAGGVVTTWDGENAANGGRIIAAGDRAVYDEARRLLLQG